MEDKILNEDDFNEFEQEAVEGELNEFEQENEEDFYQVPRNKDGEELLFPDGPTIAKVEEWKSLYKNIYFTDFDDSEGFVWRCLRRFEYKEITKVQGADTFYKEERICERCVLWPENYNFASMKDGKAGIPTYLAEQIMEKSGFSAITPSFKL